MDAEKTSDIVVEKLTDVLGADGKKNTIIYCACNAHDKTASASATANSMLKTVVYFPGDVQNLEAEMMSHRDNFRYAAWSLENVARLLYLRFASSDPQSCWRILVVQPGIRRLGTFAVYSNFLQADDLGNPRFSEDVTNMMPQAWCHLDKLLKNVSVRTRQFQHEKLIIVGFSKGCVVVNQLIREASYCSFPDFDLEPAFLSLAEIYWLDGGHNGGKNVWLTNNNDVMPCLEKAENIRLHVYMTPYQMDDPNRPWIGKECKCFVRKVKQFLEGNYKKTFKFVTYFPEETASLNNHFRILEVFEIHC